MKNQEHEHVQWKNESVTCHQEMFPFMLLYFCHYIPMARFYEVEVLDLQKIMINQAVDVCHLNTSSWSRNHPTFLELGSTPGEIEVRHWIYKNDMSWTADISLENIGKQSSYEHKFVNKKSSYEHKNTILSIQINVQYKFVNKKKIERQRTFLAKMKNQEQEHDHDQAVDVCHLNTSSWSRNHPAFLELGSTPGEIEVCHWIYKNDMSWIAVTFFFKRYSTQIQIVK
ncbi:BURP domain protein [Medicago truncatula]|uniref:BURP domain protein n=1 Tax=Medicago truncatula TaxID=3880 RepID=G7JZ06_MEDTR|nr:BURP domain protein [Medicago truncatula]